MTPLARRALTGSLQFQLFLALALFLPAWSLRFWEAWVYWAVFSASTLLTTLYFLKHDPQLVERRMRVGPGAERTTNQKVIQGVASALVTTLYVVPGLDRRFHGSPRLPVAAVLAADGLVVLGFWIFFVVLRENRYTAGTVTVEEGQRVVSTGPYRLVRHPMYAGALVLFLATPVALGSLWALIPAAALGATVVVRLLDEERFLSANLPGYDDYRRTVRSRLIPLVW